MRAPTHIAASVFLALFPFVNAHTAPEFAFMFHALVIAAVALYALVGALLA